jgi:hypothetical protein
MLYFVFLMVFNATFNNISVISVPSSLDEQAAFVGMYNQHMQVQD